MLIDKLDFMIPFALGNLFVAGIYLIVESHDYISGAFCIIASVLAITARLYQSHKLDKEDNVKEGQVPKDEVK